VTPAFAHYFLMVFAIALAQRGQDDSYIPRVRCVLSKHPLSLPGYATLPSNSLGREPGILYLEPCLPQQPNNSRPGQEQHRAARRRSFNSSLSDAFRIFSHDPAACAVLRTRTRFFPAH